ncbi:LysR family transcriptional regulator [Streptomyces sp. So13.3]|uniref:LysR family transcriptional regulator n=1 Tax=Streptomyces sp. So13.3 TaxID=2136173 RepID=UPI001105E181|nr:LysR family transcriptional regulator [Streptomyces sp. So13.3]QNA71546.1 LysR family transcriptional regulator [Streptomyces sp. So13.3]
MDPHLLRTFTTVVRLASFSAAARELGYTQSAVSQHIAALESDLGVELLGRRPVAPTEAGTRLLEHAGPLLLRMAAARAEVVRAAHFPAARLVLGASPLAFGDRTALALARLRAAAPRTDVTVRLLERAGVVAGVACGDIDLGLVDGAAAPSDPLRLPDAGPLHTAGVGEEPLAVLLPDGHPLAARDGLRLTDLIDALWLDAPDAAIPLGELRAACGNGFRPGPRYNGTDVRAVLALVRAGHGLALLPASVAGAGGVPLSAPRLVHRTESLHRGDPGPAALHLTELLSASE